jgi:hypothetical protein
MPLVALKPTSSSPEKQGFSAGRGTDSGTVTDADKAGDSTEDRWRCLAIREVKDRTFKLASFKWLKEKSVADADELPETDELATDAIAELDGALEELTAVLTLLEKKDSATATRTDRELQSCANLAIKLAKYNSKKTALKPMKGPA